MSTTGISTPDDNCGCCEGVHVLTPNPHENRPGLPALAYRIGTHSSFKMTMQAGLSDPRLSGLQTRDDDDPSMAIIDAWATVADVLTFYQERIANEGYLRTATERRSVLELARAIGYELNPGVAAGTLLAFTMEDAPGQLNAATVAQTTLTPTGQSVEDDPNAPGSALVPLGTRVLSIPAQGKLPQTFETVQPIRARVEWNALRPRLVQPQRLVIDGGVLKLVGLDGTTIPAQQLYLAGTGTNLKAGDLLLMAVLNSAGVLQPLPIAVRAVVAEPELSRTRVDLAGNLSGTPILPAVSPPTQPVADAPPDLQGPHLPLNNTNVETYILQRRWRESELSAFLKAQGWSARKVARTVNSPRVKVSAPPMEGVFAFRARLGFFGHNAPAYNSLPVQGDVLRGDAFPNNWDGSSGWEIWRDPNKLADSIFRAVNTGSVKGSFAMDSREATPVQGIEPEMPAEARIEAPRAAITGIELKEDVRFTHFDPYWDDAHVYLERAVQGLVGNGWAVFELPKAQYTVYQVSEVNEASLAAFSVSGKASGLLLKNADGSPLTRKATLTVRKTGAHVQSECMALVDVPIQEAIAAGAAGMALDRLVLGLQVGQELILSGERADLPGVAVSETVILSDIIHDKGYTTLYFLSPLQYSYTRSTVLLTANLARATHGETTREALGNGDGSLPNQRFVLKKPPLTYVSAPTPSGGKSTLEVRVDGVLWQQVSSLYGLGPRSQNYVVRIGDDGKATVIFGDGQSGARLPTGQENVIATYRTGTGPDGEVSAGSLTLLQTRPLGIRGVTNPLSAGGAEAPETLATARTNAPLTVLTLDRIVSLQDFEDFARAFAGIGKAQATMLWNGQRAVVQVTVATARGDTVASTSDLGKNLRKAIDAARDQLQQVDIAGFRPRTFSLDAGVLVDSRYVAADVLAQVTTALLGTFSFETRSFSQPVTSAEVIAAVQAIPGVIAVDLNTLTPDNGTRPADRPPTLLSADTAHVGQGAELLTINPSGIKLKEMTI
ncbi:MAG TPA: putative baseplate assembly protein [Chloroflexia bacterium]|jgi:hypothetical protein